MGPLAQFQQYTQEIYLIVKGRRFNDLTTPSGITLLQNTADWTNMFIDELETEVDPEGKPLDWKWLRQLNYSLGTATEGGASITLPTAVNELLTDEQRYVQITQDGTVVSNWAVVAPDQISSKTDRITEDMCSVTGANLLTFSRAFKDTESGGAITGDVSISFPRIQYSLGDDGTFKLTNIKVLTIVKPQLLLKLGAAKNSSLPDIVQGGLSPSFAQKYADLLNNAIARNIATSRGDKMNQEDMSGVGGVY